jgi:predicted GNAT superfamily acetyltransferase
MESATRAWDQARAAASSAGVGLSEMRDMPDALRVHRIAAAVWGEASLDPSLTHAFEHAGCGVYGATRPDGDLVGFVLGFLGWDGGLHLHSHMLAVSPEWRARGVGFALKLAQRAACLDASVDEVRWTYDPLVARNARFNLVKLGTAATAFLPDFYGEMTDRINRGDRSDRFEVRWRLASDRVDRSLTGTPAVPTPGPVVLARMGDEDTPRPKETGAAPAAGAVVEIPMDHGALRARDPELGREWRDVSGRAFRACFDAGLVAAWIDRAGRYVFVPAEDDRS